MASPTIKTLLDAVQDLYNFIFNSLPFKQSTFSGEINPSMVGFNAPVGTFYKQVDSSGVIISTFQKIGSASTAWETIGGGGGSSGITRNPKIFSQVVDPPNYHYNALNLDAIHINNSSGSDRRIIFPVADTNQSMWVYVYAASNTNNNNVILDFPSPVHNNNGSSSVVIDDYGMVLLCEYIAAENIWIISREADVY